MVKYSCVIPVWNVEEYVGRCIDSILSQTVPHSLFEIILVDDGSTDQSGDICDDYQKKYANILAIHQENQKLLKAREAGVRAAVGEYILFIDSDDYVERDLMEKIDHYLDIYQSDFVMYSYWNRDGEKKEKRPLVNTVYEISKRDFFEEFISSDRYNRVNTKVARTQLLKDHLEEIYCMKTNMAEDKLQTAYLLKYADRILLLPDCLYNYCIRNNSIARNKSAQDLFDVVSVYKQVKRVLYEIMDDLKIGSCEYQEKLDVFDAYTIDVIMGHIYKYNRRRGISYAEKLRVLQKIRMSNAALFIDYKGKVKSKKRSTIVRYKLFKSGSLRMLIRLDEVMFFFQKIMERTNLSAYITGSVAAQ